MYQDNAFHIVFIRLIRESRQQLFHRDLQALWNGAVFTGSFPMIKSAGILLYRRTGDEPEVMLVHPGGPYWKNKDEGAWSVPKGEIGEGEQAESAARREFMEETGLGISGGLVPLTPLKQKSGKLVLAWAVEQDADVSSLKSNLFEMEWPPKSGHLQQFPEVDRAQWFSMDEARRRILPGQRAFISELETILQNRR
jgi:predicted NUDIX family NTP pyrophosphohydrolase